MAACRRARSPPSRTRRRSRRYRDGRRSRCARARARPGGRAARAAPAGAVRRWRRPRCSSRPGGAGSRPSPTAGNDRHAVDPEIASRAEVREHEHADRRFDLGHERGSTIRSRPSSRTRPSRCPRPRTPARPSPPRAAATARPASAASTCTVRASLSQLSSHSPTTGITTSSTPTAGVGRAGGRDGTVEDAADGHRRGEVDRRLDQAPLGDLEEPGQLAGAVQRGRTRRDRAGGTPMPVARHDRRDAGAGDSAPCRRRRLVAHDRDVADPNAGDVGDRVRGTGLELADPEAVLRAASSRPWRRAYRVAAMALSIPARLVGRPPAARARRPRSGSASGRPRPRRRRGAEAIREALVGGGRRDRCRSPPRRRRRSRRCTTPRLLAFLASAWQDWEAAGPARGSRARIASSRTSSRTRA